MDKIVLCAYGLFLFVGAFFGWKAGSKISLISGTISGVLIFISCYLTTVNPKNGLLMALLVGGALTVVFAIRFIKTQQMMPSGMLCAVTVLFFLYCLSRYFKI